MMLHDFTLEPIETTPGTANIDECKAADCTSSENLTLVTRSDKTDASGVYCGDCASEFLFGGGRW